MRSPCEFPFVQFYCDQRPSPILEGTWAVCGVDPWNRDVGADHGAALMLLLEKVEEALAEASPLHELARWTDSTLGIRG